MGKLLLALESLQEQRIREAMEPAEAIRIWRLKKKRRL